MVLLFLDEALTEGCIEGVADTVGSEAIVVAVESPSEVSAIIGLVDNLFNEKHVEVGGEIREDSELLGLLAGADNRGEEEEDKDKAG